MEHLQRHGLYIVKDEFFSRFPSDHWLYNKREHRPHFYAFPDKTTGLFWMIPLSSSVKSYRDRIKRIEAEKGLGKCVFYFIGEVRGQQMVFDIRDMFPVTPAFVERAFEVGGAPYVSENEAVNKSAEAKARRFLFLLNTGRTPDRNGVLAIAAELLEKAAEENRKEEK